MRLLFIAPASNLSTNAELARIASGYTPEIVDGLIDRNGLERALRLDAYDAIHFCGHAGKGVLQLSDGLIDSADLVSMLDGQRGARFFFINGCDSLSLGTALHNAYHIPVIAHDAEIEDKAAVKLAQRFYGDFRRTQNVGESFDSALKTLQRLYPEQALIPTLINGDMASNSQLADCMTYVKSEIGQMRLQLDTIEAQVNKIEGKQWRLLLVVGILLILAQLATPWLNRVFELLIQ